MTEIKTVKSREVRVEVGRHPTPQDLLEAIGELRKAAMEHFGDDGWVESISFVFWDPRNPVPEDAKDVYLWAREREAT